MLDSHAEAIGQVVNRLLEGSVVKCYEPPALVADEVVMVLAARMRALEPRLAGPHRHALDQAMVDEQIQHPVDARAPCRLARRPQRVLDLHRAQRAWLASEQFDDSLTRATALEARASQHRLDVVAPHRSVCHGRRGCHIRDSLPAAPARRE